MTLIKSNHMETLKTLNNHQHYINIIQISERIQCKIQQLKQYRVEQEIDNLLLETSPTETMITYYDDNNKKKNRNNAKYKSLPKLITSNISQHSSSSTMTVMQYDKEEKATTFNSKSNVYQSDSGDDRHNGGFDSAVDLFTTAQQKDDNDLKSYPENKPLPSIYDNKFKHIPVIHTKKKYNGLKNLLKRTYHLNNIVVTRSKLSYYFVTLFSSYDEKTEEKKAVLKLFLTSNTNNLFIIPYFDFTFFHHLQSMTKQQRLLDTSLLVNIPDTQIQSALFIWLNYYHHQLPSIQHVSHILRQGLRIYIVYCV